jgi:addiction module HigA family antidote
MSEKLDLIPPGEILLEEFMRPLNISQNKLSRDINVPVGRVNDIVHGRRSITANTALRLGKFFGTTPDFWLGLQVDYDLRRAKRDFWPEEQERVRGGGRTLVYKFPSLPRTASYRHSRLSSPRYSGVRGGDAH